MALLRCPGGGLVAAIQGKAALPSRYLALGVLGTRGHSWTWRTRAGQAHWAAPHWSWLRSPYSSVPAFVSPIACLPCSHLRIVGEDHTGQPTSDPSRCSNCLQAS